MRESNSDGSVTFSWLDPNDLEAVLFTTKFDANGKSTEGIDQGIQNESIFWFWRTTPEVGKRIEVKRKSRVFGEDRSKPPTVKESTIEITYLRNLRTEILEVVGQRTQCHVVMDVRRLLRIRQTSNRIPILDDWDY